MSVSAFNPQVRCEGRVGGPGIVESCNNLLDTMSTSNDSYRFGTEGSLPVLDYPLPYVLKSGTFPGDDLWFCKLTVGMVDNRCTLTITTLSSKPKAALECWKAFWSAAVAINAMCIRAGKRELGMGWVSLDDGDNFGKRSRLTVI